MYIPDKAPDQVRYFFATPFMLIGDIFCYLGLFIMGRKNTIWQTLRHAQAIGAEIMSIEEFEEMKRKHSEQKDKE